MAESQESESEGWRARSRDKRLHHVGVHRVNNFLVGHIGQISYDPDDEETGVGRLDFSRICEQRRSGNHSLTVLESWLTTLPAWIFQQCAPLVEWLPSTRTGVSLPSSTTFQRNRSQKYWLLKTHPEAFFGNVNLPDLISQESAIHEATKESGRTRSLLALGEINNLRDARSSRTTPWPIVAMTAGEGGHILEISSVRSDKWTWANYSFPVGGIESRFHGSWRGDGSPITQLKFAAKPKRFDSMRWIIMQKETSTTIFEPELRATPITSQTSMLGQQSTTVEHIAMNPIVTLTTTLTGGQSHCDFSMNMGSEGEAPHLAIVDGSGTWSIWLLDREGQGKHSKTRAVLQKIGSLDPPLSTHLRGVDRFSANSYSIAWVNRLKSSYEWARGESPSEESDHASFGGLCNALLSDHGASSKRCNDLVVCNSTHLQVLSAADDKLAIWLDFTRRDRADALLSIHPFPGLYSHLLVLTTDAVHLLNVGVDGEHITRPPSILVSCRHYRSADRECLKMSVTRTSPTKDEVLVILYSAQGYRLDLFSFTVHQDHGTARFHHQLLQLSQLEAHNGGNNRGIESLMALPLQLRSDRKDDATQDTKRKETQFFQILGLATDLSLVSTLLAQSQGALRMLPVEIKTNETGWSERRRSRFLRNKILHCSQRAFVVADADEDDAQPSLVQPLELAVKTQTIQLRYYLERLVEEINRGFFGEAGQDDAAGNRQDPFWPILSAAQDLNQVSHVPLRPILDFSSLWQPISMPKDEDQWELDLKQLDKHQQVQLFECGRQAAKLGLMDLFEQLSINWSAKLPADGLKATQWEYMRLALERMAAEVYLSARGVYMAPQTTRDLAAKAALPVKDEIDNERDLDETQSSQTGSQRAFSTPRITPSNSRATSEILDEKIERQEDDEQSQEDAAVARLRMYLPSIKFTPPPKSGLSRVLSLWPEQRGIDPAAYEYRSLDTDADARARAARLKRERYEERKRRKAERRAQLGIKMEEVAESLSQLPPPSSMRSSPLPTPQPEVRSSRFHSQTSGFGSQSQSHSQSQSFGFPGQHTMSQPLPGAFASRKARLQKKVKPKRTLGFK